MKTDRKNWVISPLWEGGPTEILMLSRRELQEIRDRIDDTATTLGPPDYPPGWPGTVPKALVELDLLKELLDAAIGTPRRIVGARIEDPDRGVVYWARISRDGSPRLVRLEIETTSGQPVDQRALGRVPVRWIEDATAELLAANERPVVVLLSGDQVTDPGIPTSKEVAAMMRDEKLKRRDIAARYNRSVSTVDDWIGRARREVPHLMPPRDARGRRPRSIEERNPKTATMPSPPTMESGSVPPPAPGRPTLAAMASSYRVTRGDGLVHDKSTNRCVGQVARDEDTGQWVATDHSRAQLGTFRTKDEAKIAVIAAIKQKEKEQ